MADDAAPAGRKRARPAPDEDRGKRGKMLTSGDARGLVGFMITCHEGQRRTTTKELLVAVQDAVWGTASEPSIAAASSSATVPPASTTTSDELAAELAELHAEQSGPGARRLDPVLTSVRGVALLAGTPAVLRQRDPLDVALAVFAEARRSGDPPSRHAFRFVPLQAIVRPDPEAITAAVRTLCEQPGSLLAAEAPPTTYVVQSKIRNYSRLSNGDARAAVEAGVPRVHTQRPVTGAVHVLVEGLGVSVGLLVVRASDDEEVTCGFSLSRVTETDFVRRQREEQSRADRAAHELRRKGNGSTPATTGDSTASAGDSAATTEDSTPATTEDSAATTGDSA